MQPHSFEIFDPTPYQCTPRLDLVGALALAKALIELWPRQASAQLDRIAGKLELLVVEVEASLTTRRRESTPPDRAQDLALDSATDSLWSTLRGRLDAWSVFEHAGLTQVLHARGRRSATAVALLRAQRKATLAREISGRLFGADGLSFIRLPYPEQAQSMATILRLIAEDELTESIDELVGPEILVALFACQAQYEAMVEGRMSRIDRKSVDLGKLRTKLLRTIRRYSNAVLTLIDEDEPGSLDLVLRTLRPVAVLRSRPSRGQGRPKALVVPKAEGSELAATG